MPGCLILSSGLPCGHHGAKHLHGPIAGLRLWGLLAGSCVSYGGFLCNLFFFETASPRLGGLRVSNMLGYALNEASLCLFFWVEVSGRRVPSLEAAFRNLRWLEREAGELLGVFFSAKIDRRSLFTPPYLYTAPLRKSFPTSGFYELVVSPLVGGLTLARNGCA